jgi:hypothetical protein
MAEKYTKEQFWKLYRKLPPELQDALFAEETGNSIYEICKRNEVSENLDKIVDLVRQVLMGFLPPGEFQETLEKELKLKKDVAKKVTQEINRLVFYPVKSDLEKLYKIEIAPPAQMKVSPPVSEKPPIPSGEDVYREAVGE